MENRKFFKIVFLLQTTPQCVSRVSWCELLSPDVAILKIFDFPCCLLFFRNPFFALHRPFELTAPNTDAPKSREILDFQRQGPQKHFT